ncbi:MAG: SRPBCC family protein [Flavobacteriales bacterium]|nr:SRPBCC family protein [Flavobacteriales bacterium]MCB9448949.1 SRPBCC family protein [Flavobacteriales bacterium]
MKILKTIGIIAAAVIALALIIPAFTAKDFKVEREVTIQKPRSEVFDYVKLLKNQDHFSVWAQKDPNMKKGLTGTDGTVGCVSSWESDNKDVGKGEQEITAIQDGQRIDYELRFMEPYESKGNAYMTFADDAGGTRVVWGFTGSMPWPLNGMMLCMDMDGALGKDLSQGLDNLKGILEQ